MPRRLQIKSLDGKSVATTPLVMNPEAASVGGSRLRRGTKKSSADKKSDRSRSKRTSRSKRGKVIRLQSTGDYVEITEDLVSKYNGLAAGAGALYTDLLNFVKTFVVVDGKEEKVKEALFRCVSRTERSVREEMYVQNEQEAQFITVMRVRADLLTTYSRIMHSMQTRYQAGATAAAVGETFLKTLLETSEEIGSISRLPKSYFGPNLVYGSPPVATAATVTGVAEDDGSAALPSGFDAIDS